MLTRAATTATSLEHQGRGDCSTHLNHDSAEIWLSGTALSPYLRRDLVPEPFTPYPFVGPQGACEIQDSIGVYVTTGSLVFYCFGPTDRKTKWGHSLCGNMYVAIMVKDRERASSEYIRI